VWQGERRCGQAAQPCLKGSRSLPSFGGAVAHTCARKPPSASSIPAMGMPCIHPCPCRGDAPHPSIHPSLPWGCPASIPVHVVGMPRIQLCHGVTPHPAVPWSDPTSSCAVGLPCVCLCHGGTLCPSMLWVFPLPILAVGMPQIHPHHGVAPCPSAPWDCPRSIYPMEMPRQVCLLPPNAREQALPLPAASACLHVLGGSIVPMLGSLGCSLSGGNPVCPVEAHPRFRGMAADTINR